MTSKRRRILLKIFITVLSDIGYCHEPSYDFINMVSFIFYDYFWPREIAMEVGD